jgi:hypothetical protein
MPLDKQILPFEESGFKESETERAGAFRPMNQDAESEGL